MLEKDAMHFETEADVFNRNMGFDKEVLIDSRIRLAAANKGALKVLDRTPIIALNMGECSLWMSFLVVKNLDESDQSILSGFQQ